MLRSRHSPGRVGRLRTDDADFTAASTAGTPIMGAYQSTPTAVTDTDLGIIGIDSQRRVKVTVDNTTLDVAHDAPDASTMPVKIGGKALSASPTPVATSDRTNAHFDLYGRQRVGVMDPGMQVWKQVEATTTQTGTAIWTPTAGKKIAVTRMRSERVARPPACYDLVRSQRRHDVHPRDRSGGIPGQSHAELERNSRRHLQRWGAPIYCTTADHVLRYTTSAGITVYITLYGFEY